ncbi:hypothetical protein ACSBR2_015031 [Camellia fascicularis]
MRNGCAISLALIEGSNFGQTSLLKKEKTKEMVSHYIHEDVMVEILVKLPVKSLLRFKCVSKSWSSLITNPSFIAKHLTNSNKKENGCLFVHSIEPKDANNFPRKYTFAVCRDKSLTVPVFEYLGLKLNAKVHVMGPCNGIFCLLTNWNSVALWNPANRESRALPTQTFPNSIPPRMELERNAFGFGMDPFTGDYKVVSIRMYSRGSGLDNDIHPSSYPKHIAIYSLRDDSWRDFKGFFPECSVSSICKFYTYMDGVYYWSACNKNDDATKLSFHMGYEVFQNILEQDEPVPFKGIPELGCPHPGTNLVGHYFGVYNGSLAWIQSYPTHYAVPNVFNIWVLKYERWTRELIAGPFEGAIPLGFWKKGEFLIQVEDGHLYLVDPITLEMKDLRTVASQAIVYHESLVSVQRRDEAFDHSYITLRLKFDIFY